jgi:hypothetical protein
MKRVICITVLGLLFGAVYTPCARLKQPTVLRADGQIPPPPIIIWIA